MDRHACPGPWHSGMHFRRTCIGDILDAGHDLASARQLVGHASPAPTARATADLRSPLPGPPRGNRLR